MDNGSPDPVFYSFEALCRKQTPGICGAEMLSYVPDFVLHEAQRALASALGKLAPRERDIIERRFGLSADGQMTVGSIASKWGLTNERVRQITRMAIVKLRHLMAQQYGARHGLLLQLDIPEDIGVDMCSRMAFHPQLWSLLTADAELRFENSP